MLTAAGAASTNPRTSGGNVYNPYYLPTAGYGLGADPYAAGGAAAGLATSAAESNLAAAPDIAKISQLINSLNEAQQQQLNRSRLGPQGEQIQANLLTNVEAGSRGELTPSEMRVLQQSVAENWGVRGFGPDAPAGIADYTNRYLRTQYEREQDAEANYARLLAENPSAPLFNASELMVSPAQYSATAAAQAQRQLEQERLAQQAYQFEEQMRLQERALAAKQGVYRGPGGTVTSGSTAAPRAAAPDTGYLYATGVTSTGTGGGGTLPLYQDVSGTLVPQPTVTSQNWAGEIPQEDLSAYFAEQLDPFAAEYWSGYAEPEYAGGAETAPPDYLNFVGDVFGGG